MVNNGTRPPRGKRRACDLCCIKKIKCDRLEPECSNCVLYNAACTSGNPPGPPDSTKRRTTTNRGSSKRRRVAAEQARGAVPSNSPKASHLNTSGRSIDEDSSSNRPQLWKFSLWEPTLYHGPSAGAIPSLPPLENIMPIIESYFRVANQAVPLFTQDTFMRLVSGWYRNKNPKRDRPTCAAVLVVIALGLGCLSPGSGICSDSHERAELESFCLRNAQGILWELTTSSDHLIVVQAMLGLVMLFTKPSDLRPAGILISVAMRMSQRLQLHSSSSLTQFAANEGNERTRVFWVAYILDREISLRTRTPFIHCDTDIDVPLPTRDPEGHGTVWSSDGSSKLEFFRHRVELARLQGKIYDALFSSSALKLAPTERQKTVIKVDDMLNQWYSYIPLAFRLENAIQHAGEAVIISLTDMYHVYLSAIIITHGVYSRNAEWIQVVGLLGRAAIEDFAVALKGSRACTLNPNPPIPHAWDRCVNASRSCMKLFQAARLPDFYIYHSVCAHYSALLILLANNLIRPSHRHASADFQIAAISIELVDDTLHLAESPVYQSLHTVITDLFQRLNGTRGHAIQLWEGTPAGGDHATTEFQHSTQEHLGAHAVGAENDLLGFFETGGVLDGFGTDEIDLDFF